MSRAPWFMKEGQSNRGMTERWTETQRRGWRSGGLSLNVLTQALWVGGWKIGQFSKREMRNNRAALSPAWINVMDLRSNWMRREDGGRGGKNGTQCTHRLLLAMANHMWGTVQFAKCIVGECDYALTEFINRWQQTWPHQNKLN